MYLSAPLPYRSYNIQPRFSGVLADSVSSDGVDYVMDHLTQAQGNELRRHITSLSRETVKALVALIKDLPAVDCHLIGISDGSIIVNYGAACRKAKIQDKVKFFAIDDNEAFVALAKTGRMVCTDKEKDATQELGDPLQHRWDYYFSPSDRPDDFSSLVAKYRPLAQIEHNRVTGERIGEGMAWYQVNQRRLPRTTFDCKDMKEYVTQPHLDDKDQVYVLSNTWGHTMLDEAEIKNFMRNQNNFWRVIQDIRNNNIPEGQLSKKKVFIVTGALEDTVFDIFNMGRPLYVRSQMNRLGMRPVDLSPLRGKGLSEEEIRKAKGHIWELDISSRINFVSAN